MSVADELSKLNDLKIQGVISEAEFEIQKLKVLENGANSSAPPVVTVQLASKRFTAGILALLLGGLGFHKFYLGKPISGILYLVFCWTFIPAIIALFEGLSYLCMTDSTFNSGYDKNSPDYGKDKGKMKSFRLSI